MRPPERSRAARLAAVGAGLALPPAVAALQVPFRGRFADPAAALVLTAVVVAVATFGDRLAGVVASLSAGAWFDFFLTKPYDRFSISAARDIETTLSLIVVGVAVTEIAVRGRRHFAVAQTEGNLLATIRDLSEMVATGADREALLGTANASLGEVLGLEGCRFEPVLAHDRRARLARTGEIELEGSVLDSLGGLPAVPLEILAESGKVAYGVFVVPVTEGHRLTIEQRVAALAVADQVGAGLAMSAAAA